MKSWRGGRDHHVERIEGGIIDVRSLQGRIVGSDRAFDDANRYNTSARIDLASTGNIVLSVTSAINDGATDNRKAVVSTLAGVDGHGGTNTLRSFAGGISVGTSAQVQAGHGSNGTNGVNAFTSCSGLTLLGVADPVDLVPGDNTNTCSPTAPAALFSGGGAFGVVF